MFRINTSKQRRLSLTRILIMSLIVWAILTAASIYIGKTSSVSISTYQERINNLSNGSSLARVIDIRDYRELGVLDNLPGYYLLYFEQKDCPGCKEVSPAINKYFSSNNSQVGLARIHIDDIFNSNQDAALQLISRYRVLGTPTLILLNNGVEVARHIGVFRGDQYEGLKTFIEDGMKSRSAAGVFAFSPLLPLSLGALAAVSPCSLPMLALFTTVSRNIGRNIAGAMKTLASMIVVLVPASLGLGVLFTFGRVLGISIYYSLVTYMGVLTTLWGVLTLIDRDPLWGVSGRASLLFPILGVQCSFPFLLALLPMISKSPIEAFIQAVAFSIGYSAPYIAASVSAGRAAKTVKALSRGKRARIFKYLQGIILISIGVYILINGLPYIA